MNILQEEIGTSLGVIVSVRRSWSGIRKQETIELEWFTGEKFDKKERGVTFDMPIALSCDLSDWMYDGRKVKVAWKDGPFGRMVTDVTLEAV